MFVKVSSDYKLMGDKTKISNNKLQDYMRLLSVNVMDHVLRQYIKLPMSCT